MTIEFDPIILTEIKEQAKEWLEYETTLHKRILKEKHWNVVDEHERKIINEVCMGSIAHRVVEALYPEEYKKLQNTMLEALNTVKEEN